MLYVLYTALENDEYPLCFFTDLWKAFITADDSILQLRLEQYDIQVLSYQQTSIYLYQGNIQQHIKHKTHKTDDILSKIRYVPQTIILKLYYSLIYSYLTYAFCIWESTTANQLQPTITDKKTVV